MSEHVIEEIDPEAERDAILTLHRAVYPSSGFDAELFAWRYLECPDGPAPVLAIRAADRLAATTVLWPRPLTWRGERRPGWLMIDVMTHPDDRGRGMLRAMSNESARLGRERGHFVCGYPNERSVDGYRKTGWAAPDHVPSWEGPTDPGRCAPSVAFEPIAPADIGPWAEALWLSMDRIGVHRDASYLRWRLARPRADYMVYAPADRSALLVLKRYGAGADMVLNLCELMVRPGADEVADAAVSVAHQRARELGASRVSAWAKPGGGVAAALSRGGLAPTPNDRVILWLAPPDSGDDDRPWHVAQLDSDVY